MNMFTYFAGIYPNVDKTAIGKKLLADIDFAIVLMVFMVGANMLLNYKHLERVPLFKSYMEVFGADQLKATAKWLYKRSRKKQLNIENVYDFIRNEERALKMVYEFLVCCKRNPDIFAPVLFEQLCDKRKVFKLDIDVSKEQTSFNNLDVGV